MPADDSTIRPFKVGFAEAKLNDLPHFEMRASFRTLR
jgi:hypothetical protein